MAGNTKAIGVAYRDQLIAGTTTNDNAIAGDVGEYFQFTIPVGSAVALTTATPANLTSISLGAGDWDIDFTIDFLPVATTSVTQYNASVSVVSATLATQPGGAGLFPEALYVVNQAAAVPAGVVGVTGPTVRASFAATTTIYLVGQMAFTVSTASMYGTLRVRRVR